MGQLQGILLVVLAGILQGSFILPMTLVKNWNWENIWLVFSIFGMVILNGLIAFTLFDDLPSIYNQVELKELVILCLFGFGWGLGAVLFGIGMDKLGMSVGYPIIMGLIASIGGLLPMLVQHSEDALKPSGVLLIIGNVIIISGIIICSKAVAQKTPGNNSTSKKALTTGIMIAVAAGILSSLPNIGFSFGTSIMQAAIDSGVSKAFAGNAVWALFFSVGFLPNLIYTAFLIRKNKNAALFFTTFPVKNFFLGIFMAIMWIGSFYIYGISSYKLGEWGNIIGWPLFISVSIVIGNIWGIHKGEWSGASKMARRKLNLGLITLLIAMVIIGMSNLL